MPLNDDSHCIHGLGKLGHLRKVLDSKKMLKHLIQQPLIHLPISALFDPVNNVVRAVSKPSTINHHIADVHDKHSFMSRCILVSDPRRGLNNALFLAFRLHRLAGVPLYGTCKPHQAYKS